MEPEPRLAPADEVHSYLVGELNDALRRPEMWGGEVAIRTMLTHLLVMERDASPRRAYLDCANRRGMTSPTAVRIAVRSGYGPFAETFTHTPEGHRRQAEPTSEP